MIKGVQLNGKWVLVWDHGEILKVTKMPMPVHDNGNGYITFSHGYKKYYVHRVVAMTFLPNPLNLPQVNHKNGIKNDNRVDNLEWCTASYNQKHAYSVLGKRHPKNQSGKSGFNHHNSRAVEQLDKNTGEVIKVYGSIREAAKDMGVVSTAISNSIKKINKMNYCKGFDWRYSDIKNIYERKYIYFYVEGVKKRKLNPRYTGK